MEMVVISTTILACEGNEGLTWKLMVNPTCMKCTSESLLWAVCNVGGCHLRCSGALLYQNIGRMLLSHQLGACCLSMWKSCKCMFIWHMLGFTMFQFKWPSVTPIVGHTGRVL
jgi:hypothetical protein